MVYNQKKNQPSKINCIKAEMIDFRSQIDKDFKEAIIQQQKKIKGKKDNVREIKEIIQKFHR